MTSPNNTARGSPRTPRSPRSPRSPRFIDTELTPLLSAPAIPTDQVLTRHQCAAWLVELTLAGVETPFDPTHLPRSAAKRRAHLFFENTRIVSQTLVLVLLALSFWEVPDWCDGSNPDLLCTSPDGSDLFLSGISYISRTWGMIVELVCVLILMSFLIFERRLVGDQWWEADERRRVVWIVLFLELLDCLTWGVYTLVGGGQRYRFALYLRCVLPFLYFPAIWDVSKGIISVLGPFCDALGLLVVFTLGTGWVGTLLFHEVPDAQRYFGTLPRGLYTTFTSMTTADWPMQIMAVLDDNRLYCIAFFLFIIFGVFYLFNFLLGACYAAYTDHMERHVVSKVSERERNLAAAYNLMISEVLPHATMKDIKLLFEEMRKNHRFSDMDSERVNLVFEALDDNGDEVISQEEFLDLVEIVGLRLEYDTEASTWVERYLPGFFKTQFWQKIVRFVRSPHFEMVINSIMVINCGIVVFESTMDLHGKDTPGSALFFGYLEVLFSCVYILESFLKISVETFWRYWRAASNKFDFIVSWLLFFASIYVVAPQTGENDPTIIRYFIILRLLRLLALLSNIQRFRNIANCFNVLLPASIPLFSAFFLVVLIFSVLGVHLFGGLIYLGNPALDPKNNILVDAYKSNDYFDLNFNDIPAAFFTLFSSVIVAYLTEVAAAVASVTGTDWSLWYFIIFFMVSVCLVSNVIIAFVVDLFIATQGDIDENGHVVMYNQLSSDNNVSALERLTKRYGPRGIRVRMTHATHATDRLFVSIFKDKIDDIYKEHLP
eukprot:Plantae.Rhodophyta-Hildenbrandia_rubra.ctg6189.p1 GENE.Plantae.Rhodophyta-Hildenbrandia_rubra.ctg6189~~Plantae.Rhodophyta-Hildenbrandia_rubra.ctg6189.p1  ORF type:complete len:775 (-),score=87.14 Plantae.Rhodophyta-Hildenbrandia_rubra.ctg6189:404-2728(-)